MKILAIESSCDETAAAIVSREDDDKLAKVGSSIVASQIPLHQKYGGVYPEVASREHARKILPVIAEAIGLTLHPGEDLPDFKLADIDYIAVTNGPGLIGSLLVGTQTAATIAYASKTPLLPVNHLAGHIYASFIASGENSAPEFPLLALVVSGGHTMLILMNGHHQFQLLGQTRDDAAGEAFDKVAKLLGLGYPGGPLISKLATKGNREAFNFPIGLEHEKTFDFSFSGLKTAVLREVQALPQPLTPQTKADVAASFERAVVDALLIKTTAALKQFPVGDLILGGGVAANTYLRDRLGAMLALRENPVAFHVPSIELCTDNAAVIGSAAAFSRLKAISPTKLQTFARLALAEIPEHTGFTKE